MPNLGDGTNNWWIWPFAQQIFKIRFRLQQVLHLSRVPHINIHRWRKNSSIITYLGRPIFGRHQNLLVGVEKRILWKIFRYVVPNLLYLCSEIWANICANYMYNYIQEHLRKQCLNLTTDKVVYWRFIFIATGYALMMIIIIMVRPRDLEWSSFKSNLSQWPWRR